MRLGALGDLVHTVPAVAALRQALPNARLDWVVDARHAAFLDLVMPIDRVLPLERSDAVGWVDMVRRLRPSDYDVALDFQGLMKSAVLARASGARRVIGFSIWHLREKGARPFYSEVERGAPTTHVIQKNLGLLATIGVHATAIEVPLAVRSSAARDQVRAEAGGRALALLNPGAAWPNKRWPAPRFAEVAVFLREVRGLAPIVVWGPGEEALAQAVVEACHGAARLAPPTTMSDLVELSRDAALMVSGDTGPLHIAAAAGTPVVAIFGPTDPERNGPWAIDDIAVSRFAGCACHYRRHCRERSWCLADVQVSEVTAAIQRRLADAAHRLAGPAG